MVLEVAQHFLLLVPQELELDQRLRHRLPPVQPGSSPSRPVPLVAADTLPPGRSSDSPAHPGRTSAAAAAHLSPAEQRFLHATEHSFPFQVLFQPSFSPYWSILQFRAFLLWRAKALHLPQNPRKVVPILFRIVLGQVSVRHFFFAGFFVEAHRYAVIRSPQLVAPQVFFHSLPLLRMFLIM